ncbi:Cytochrome P450 26C1 [Manis pentadactyla]|nr:Cytochrome P450 26C1 [Manis pentadactyla]
MVEVVLVVMVDVAVEEVVAVVVMVEVVVMMVVVDGVVEVVVMMVGKRKQQKLSSRERFRFPGSNVPKAWEVMWFQRHKLSLVYITEKPSHPGVTTLKIFIPVLQHKEIPAEAGLYSRTSKGAWSSCKPH